MLSSSCLYGVNAVPPGETLGGKIITYFVENIGKNLAQFFHIGLQEGLLGMVDTILIG